jgi:signal transduction histidine kinase/CheY-like chemotaxis protein
MVPRPPSAVTRSIYLGTIVALVLVATLSVVIYRSAVDDAVTQSANQQLATVRTAAVGIQAELESVGAQLRQFSSLPSVQNLDIPFLGQRVAAAFDGASNGRIRFVVRVDPAGRLFVWSPGGQLMVDGAPMHQNDELWRWGRTRDHASQVRMLASWDRSTPTERALVVPVWRDSPSAQLPDPPRDFNGLLAIVIDIDRLMRTYLDPARREMAAGAMVVGLATPGFGLRLGPGESAPAVTRGDAHDHAEDHGSELLDGAEGRRVHAWARFGAADERWLVASSVRYESVAAQIQGSAFQQLGLSAVLLVSVPIVGWLIARRERRAQEEQRDLERRLAESQKMEAIGKLAGGIAHDFNNMLTAILGYASMIQEDAPPRSAIRDQAQQIRRAAENAAALTQKLLAFSRKQVLHADPLDFRSMLGNLLPLVRGAVGEDIKVSTQTGEDLWPILADPVQLEQSILNLALNARDAMPKGGTLQIDSRNASRPKGERRHDADVKPGDYVQITVTDTGAGMDEATRTRMFEPFFTTKAPGKGTGLGLSTVYGFVRQCGGFISVLSTPGQGTSIELLLPRARTAVATPPTSPAQGDASVGGNLETVLVAEDEDGVRELTLETLKRRGYRVLTAASGEDAIKLASAYDGTIHLLISDVVMPGMKGPELAVRLRAMRPGIKVLFVSGYAADVVTPNDLREASLLSKPFSPAALIKAVRASLDVPLSSAPASQP